jgi:hypothetical protein
MFYGASIMPKSSEQLIEQYGEKYRVLILDALLWLDIREPVWKLDKPIDRDEYIAELINHAS